jgi:aminopeptidase N
MPDMPGLNLTRDEARERSELLRVDSYDIDLDLTTGEDTFLSTVTVKFASAHKGARTWLDLAAPAVREVILNGKHLEPDQVFDGSRVGLAPLQKDNEVRVVAECAYSHSGEGLHRFVDPVDNAVYLYTQFEVPDARRVFACFDQPDLKATFKFSVTAPDHWQVVSNAATPEPQQVIEKVARWEFAPTPRISTYITALVAGPYHVVRDQYDGPNGTIPLGLFCRQSLAQYLDAEPLFEVTKQGFQFFEDAFGVGYPFDKYDQLFVPEFNAGAMENAGAVTFREDYIFRSRTTDAAYERRASVILHEMAHQWFGDLVTMQWWNDLWLNESFATWAAALAQAGATRWKDAWTTFANTEKLWALYQDQLPTTHPISAEIRDLEDVFVNFDGITYAKGASALKQLVAWVGRDKFLAGLHAYFDKHAYGNTELVDLFACLERTSGRDLKAWEQQWLLTAGVNTIRPKLSIDGNGIFTDVQILQETPPEHPTLRSHRLAVGVYDTDDNERLVRLSRVELDVTEAETRVPGLVGKRQPALLLLNDDDLTFAKVRLDRYSLETLRNGGIAALVDSLPRAMAWTSTTDMLRDAEFPARHYVELVLGGIGTETELPVVQNLLNRAQSAVELYTDPDAYLAVSARWATGLHELMHRAQPESDHQLAFARAWAVAVGSPEHTAELYGLLSGERTLEGLKVDTDLRWHLLQRLVALGVATTEDIDAELERDNTASGRRQAAQARAMRPTREAKEEAWELAVVNTETHNAIQEATLLGFHVPGQREVLRPFVDRYFAVLLEVWNTRSLEFARNIVVRLFPRQIVEQSIVQKADAWLESAADAPPALRRLVIEGRADVVRALAAQERDRAEGEFIVARVALPMADALRAQ